MNPLHLLWIIPLSSTMGVLAMCLAVDNETSRDVERRNELGRALHDLYLAETASLSFAGWKESRAKALAQAKKVLGL